MVVSALLSVVLLAVVAISLTHAQDVNYFGVDFSPYVRHKLNGVLDSRNSYNITEIKQMLNIIINNHNSVATYDMGVNKENYNKPWNQTESNCLVARAAALINKEQKSVVLSISLGIRQFYDNVTLQAKEIENAFLAAGDANSIYPGTVYNLIFNTYNISDKTNGQIVLSMLQNNATNAHKMGLRLGARVEGCRQIYGGQSQAILKQIATAADFIICDFYASKDRKNKNPAVAVQDIHNRYFSARDGFWKNANRKLEVIVGAKSWTYGGKKSAPENTVHNLAKFWKLMQCWSAIWGVKVQMFEAFDQPGMSELSGETSCGWWSRNSDNSPAYLERATNKSFS